MYLKGVKMVKPIFIFFIFASYLAVMTKHKQDT